MQALYYLKAPSILFLAGLFLRSIGALVKIRHWPYGDELITFGSIVTGIGIIYATVKIIRLKKPE
jgi:hypothetical protein